MIWHPLQRASSTQIVNLVRTGTPPSSWAALIAHRTLKGPGYYSLQPLMKVEDARSTSGPKCFVVVVVLSVRHNTSLPTVVVTFFFFVQTKTTIVTLAS